MKLPFGLMTRKEVQQQIEEALKAEIGKYQPWLLQTADAERFNLPDPSVYENQADLYRKLSWVLQAVEITANAGAVSRFDVKRIIANEEPKDIPNHPFETLLQRPNPLDSRFEFLVATIEMWKLTGNCYWWLNRESEFDPPSEMWIIPSHMIQPVPDGKMFIRGYLYWPGNGMEIMLPPHEIVHFRRNNPFSRFIGLSAIEAIALVARGDLSMQEWNTRLFAENNARLPGILTFEQMIADPTWEKIKADTREAARKRELLMLRGVGGGGVHWMQNAVAQKDMEFLAGRQFNKEEIYNTLAPGLYSMLSENATEANSRTGRAAFAELTIYPMHVMMAEKITKDILPAYGSGRSRPLIGQFEDVRMEDKQLRLAEMIEYSKSHTVEEVRREFYGDEPLGDDRDRLLPSQITATSGGIQKPAPNPFDRSRGQDPEQEDEMPGERRRGRGEPPAEKAIKAYENSSMIALRIPDVIRQELERQYPFIQADILQELHITLVYLGDSRTLDKANIFGALNEFVLQQAPIKGKLQGLARFVSGHELDPVVITFDSPQMPKVYSLLTSILESRHIPYHRDHGFIPHITLAYIPANKRLPIHTVEPLEMNFNDVCYVDGGEWIPFPLAGYANKKAEDNDSTRLALEELRKFERKALKKVGKSVEFQSDAIPADIMDYLTDRLPKCSSETAVKALFDSARSQIREEKQQSQQPSDAAMVLEGIRLALAQLERTKA